MMKAKPYNVQCVASTSRTKNKINCPKGKSYDEKRANKAMQNLKLKRESFKGSCKCYKRLTISECYILKRNKISATIHVLSSLQGFTSLRMLSDVESKILVRDGIRVPVK
ncbi:Retrovirus-related Pol polyprotein from transposon TNT 1-94 [Sesbania bispinosa]|nr:Retrovirus-related Pol polyprotein from transposon TNT 1-94 [Sesbania bispinosa]